MPRRTTRSLIQSIQYGLQKYKHLLQTTQGPLRLTYFHNLRWDGHSLDVTEKPHGNRAFGTFEVVQTLSGSFAQRHRPEHEGPTAPVRPIFRWVLFPRGMIRPPLPHWPG